MLSHFAQDKHCLSSLTRGIHTLIWVGNTTDWTVQKNAQKESGKRKKKKAASLGITHCCNKKKGTELS